ncbi:uncharacterized protein EV420DRAFT_1480739 [Desarmillaria tabescens]|uniref:Uncharacterized protein n=1 Tax=Armillaria tabescens TaxID=1929756 RepID=A0AA39N4M6_ARMTA|nr:uncharacterized protein EV420DRAFT_1480739 [Desarmillaria tabescens]KAK0457264.1 hypothetical protein EV420DRAFT_1480739 [Desarmillaria tabescens]
MPEPGLNRTPARLLRCKSLALSRELHQADDAFSWFDKNTWSRYIARLKEIWNSTRDHQRTVDALRKRMQDVIFTIEEERSRAEAEIAQNRENVAMVDMPYQGVWFIQGSLKPEEYKLTDVRARTAKGREGSFWRIIVLMPRSCLGVGVGARQALVKRCQVEPDRRAGVAEIPASLATINTPLLAAPTISLPNALLPEPIPARLGLTRSNASRKDRMGLKGLWSTTPDQCIRTTGQE